MKVIMIAILTILAAAFSLEVAAGDSEGLIMKAEIPGIENFSKITESSGIGGSPVGFGGATEPVAMAALKAQGFEAVVNLRLAMEDGVDAVHVSSPTRKHFHDAADDALRWLATHQSPEGHWSDTDALGWCDGKRMRTAEAPSERTASTAGVTGLACCAYLAH